jgi:protein-arginine kinase activator protein McsA
MNCEVCNDAKARLVVLRDFDDGTPKEDMEELLVCEECSITEHGKLYTDGVSMYTFIDSPNSPRWGELDR